jgi:hypothetical protein
LNDALGYYAGGFITTGTANVAIGYEALTGITGAKTTGSYNTAVGNSALTTCQGACNSNTAVGYYTLSGLTTGANSTAMGDNALVSDTTGQNDAFGMLAGEFITTGSANVAVGYEALMGATGAKTTGSDNTAVGYTALNLVQGASAGNTALGEAAGSTITTGSNDLYLGYATVASGATVTNEIAVGEGVTGAGSNTAVIGNASVTDVYLGGAGAVATLHVAGISSLLKEIAFGFNNSPSVLTAQTACGVVTYTGTITGINMITDVTGTATVDIYTVALASYTGIAGIGSYTEIANGGVTMTGVTYYNNTTLTSWTKAITATAAAPKVVCFALSSPSLAHTLSGKLTLTAAQ